MAYAPLQMKLCSRAYLLLRREKRSGAPVFPVASKISVTTGEPLQRALPPPAQLLDAIRDFGNDPPAGQLLCWFHSTVHSSCSVTVPRFLNRRPARMQLPYPLQTMKININCVTTCVFQPITRSNGQSDAGYK
jgi:hypothetical protein